jgi:alpha-beta hydrolase superfamily lysophospholipase
MKTLLWQPDRALDGFEAATLSLPDAADGPVNATLIRKKARQRTGRAVLYLHGFIDYFFQAHMAQRYEELGYTFYALDLRRYGRSLQAGQRPNYTTDLTEYYAELDAAIEVIDREEGQPWLLLNGHSTGGLTSALYAHEGRQRARVGGLFLNSPFFDFNATASQRISLALASAVGRFAPGLPIAGAISPLYAQSAHRDHRGAWSFNTDWKPIAGFPAYTGWLRAIGSAQRRLQAGLQIGCPILLLHSARSATGAAWRDEFATSDIVLNIQHMRRYGPGLGREVRLVAIPDGMHDLMLSIEPARTRVFAELAAWLGQIQRT